MTGVETDTKTEVNRVLSDIVQNEKVLSSYVLDHDHSLKLGDARPGWYSNKHYIWLSTELCYNKMLTVY